MDQQEGYTPQQFIREHVSAKARNVRIEVHIDGEIRLVIPRSVSKRLAYEFLDSRTAWIQQKYAEMHATRARQSPPLNLKWDGKDRFPLRGTLVPLQLMLSRASRPVIRFGDGIVLSCPASLRDDHAVLTRTLRAGLRQLVRNEAQQLLEEEAERLDVHYSGPRIADQRSLWGSCSPDGLISLNWRLILAPPEVLRYVVVHELCHRRHHDHSQRFWRLLEKQMPDYTHWRHWLRDEGARLHRILPKSAAGAA